MKLLEPAYAVVVACFSAGQCEVAFAPAGTNFLDAFQSCLLMKLGARRRINASCLACPGRISTAPAFNDTKDGFTNSSVVIRLTPLPSARSPVSSVFTAGGMRSITSTPVSSNWNRSDWV